VEDTGDDAMGGIMDYRGNVSRSGRCVKLSKQVRVGHLRRGLEGDEMCCRARGESS